MITTFNRIIVAPVVAAIGLWFITTPSPFSWGDPAGLSPRPVSTASRGNTSASLGLELTDDVALESLDLFDAGKFQEALDSLDNVINEKTAKDQERIRELKLMAGILIARSGADKCVAKAKQRFSAAKASADKRGTSFKAAVAFDAVDWAVKDGVKGQPPDLKSQDRWLRAIDGARQDYEKELSKKQPMLTAKIHDHSFGAVRPYVEATSKTMDLVNVIKHQPEKNKEVAKQYTSWLREAKTEIGLEIAEIRSKIADLESEIDAAGGSSAAMTAKRRQIREKISTREKDIREGQKAQQFLETEASKYAK